LKKYQFALSLSINFSLREKMSNIKVALERVSEIVNEKMEAVLPAEMAGRVGENRLARAMRYSSLAGGKRVRPFLVMESAALFGVSESCSAQVAAAIEFVHTFSLIHDDLPALDDDDVRRGQPSCHVQFDEATAILAGDALLAFAFEVLSHDTTHSDPSVRCQLVQAFAKAIGPKGMVGGQMIDMISEDTELNIDQITRLQRMKTGELFAVSCESGAILGKAPQNLRTALRGFANNIGLVFQITDDLLDAISDTNLDGAPRINKSAEKGTYISVIGVEKARRQAEILTEQAIEFLNAFDRRADNLRDLARYILNRSN
jgi:farnesyl diphosphate synthase